MANEFNFGDPRLLFELWRQFTGEDLTISKAAKRDPKKRKDKNNKVKNEENV